MAAAVALSGAALFASPNMAHAAAFTDGPGYNYRHALNANGVNESLVGAAQYVGGNKIWCIQAGRLWAPNTKSFNVVPAAGLSNTSGVAAEYQQYQVSPSEAAYLLKKYDSTNNSDIAAALSVIVHASFENDNFEWYPGSGASPADRVNALLNQVSSSPDATGVVRSNVLPTAAQLVQEARSQVVSNAEPGYVENNTLTVHGQITGIKAYDVNGNAASGIPMTLTLSGPATFADGSTTKNIVSDANGSSFDIKATGNGTATMTVTYENLSARGLQYFDAVGSYQDMLYFEHLEQAKAPVSLQYQFKTIFVGALATEKSISYTNKQVVDDTANKVTQLDKTVFALYKDGKPVNWEDTTIFPDLNLARVMYDDDGSTDGMYRVDGQLTNTRPSSGPVEFYANHDGYAMLTGVVAQGEYELREIQRPANTENVEKTVSFTADPATATRVLGPKFNDMPLFERSNDETKPDIDADDKGVTNELQKFGFTVEKSFTQSNTVQPVTEKVADDTKFSSVAEDALTKEKMKYADVRFELQYKDGTPVKWKDKTMFFSKKTDKLPHGSYDSKSSTVRFIPDEQGLVEVHDLLAVEKEYQLVEVKTADRSTLDVDKLAMSSTDNNNDLTETRGFQNDVDMTGVALKKTITYKGSDEGTDIGRAQVAGAEYTMYYGDGPKKDQPVQATDYVLDLMKKSADTTVSTSGNLVFTTNANGTVATIDNIVWGSYYLMETKSATGLHLDKTRYYFGDKVDMPEGSKYLDSKTVNETSTKDSTAIESSGTSADDVRLISSELEKQARWLKTDSPFQTSQPGEWGTSASKLIYNHGEVNDVLVNNESPLGEAKTNDVGQTRRGGVTYGLFYAADTVDGQSVKGQPVKWTDDVVKHMTIQKGDKVLKDYTTTGGVKVEGNQNVVLSTDTDADAYGRIQVSDIAYGSYYWKELDSTSGFALDAKEYAFGDIRTDDAYGNYAGPTDKNAPKNVTTADTQTNAEVSKVDTSANYEWKNTFDNDRKSGSTNTVATFGFNGLKMAQADPNDKIDANGENGVELTLTPIEGTQGDPLKTKTFRKQVLDNANNVQNVDGYFEFRTVPYGRYLLTSNSQTGDGSGNSILQLLSISPIIADFSADENGDYTISFFQDTDGSSTLDPNVDLQLSTFTSRNSKAVPNQELLNRLKTEDVFRDTLTQNDGQPYYGEDHVWDRDNHVDVASDGTKDNNFVSAEVNVGTSGFEVNDKIAPTCKLGTTATDAADGDKIVDANTDVTINDRVEISPSNGPCAPDGSEITLKAQPVDQETGNPIGDPIYHTTTVQSKDGKTIVDVPVTVNTANLHGKKITMFETLYKGKVTADTESSVKPEAEHANKDDEAQTVTVTHRGTIGTTATNTKDDSKVVAADVDQAITDTIDLTNARLAEGQVYTVENAIPVVPWTNSMPAPKGEWTKFTELNGNVSANTPVLDERGNKGLAMKCAATSVVRDYDTAKVNGQDVKLNPNQFVYSKGMTNVKVNVSGCDLTAFRARQPIVMFEKIAGKSINPLVHADINDDNQTVTTATKIDTAFSSVSANGASAIGVAENEITSGKIYNPLKSTEVRDVVTLSGVAPGTKLTSTLTLMTPTEDATLDKADGVEDGMTPYLDTKGEKVVGVKTFTPTKTNVKYSTFAKFVANKDMQKIVAYSVVTDKDGNVVVSHVDPKAESQTITPSQPKITTTAHNADGGKVALRHPEAPMYDDSVTEGLQPGDKYTVTAKLNRCEAGSDGKVVTDTCRVVATVIDKDVIAADGVLKKTFEAKVDTTNDTKTIRYVWTESLTDSDSPNNELASHSDLNNADQTLTVDEKPSAQLKPEGFSRTGGEVIGILLVISALLAASLAGYEVISRR